MKRWCQIVLGAAVVLGVSAEGAAKSEKFPFDDAVAVWHMADLKDSAGKHRELSVDGKVKLGLELTGVEREASLRRGGDGYVAEFNGGFLSTTQGVENELTLSGKEITLCVRICDPAGEWSAPVFSKAGSVFLEKAGTNVITIFELVAWSIGGAPYFLFQKGITGQPSFQALRTPAGGIRLKDWRDIIVRYNGSQLQLFVDGILRDEKSTAGALFESKTGAGRIGHVNFHGRIDHVALWNRALTDNEVTFLSGGSVAIKRLKKLEQADDAESMTRVMKGRLANPYFPKYHLTARLNAMGDAHPFYFKGNYHMFYQTCTGYCPKPTPGPPEIRWGHAVSPDLIHWKHYPDAITPWEHGLWPSSPIWSGCLVDNNGVGTAVYTMSNIDVWIATSKDKDLKKFTAYAGNPVVKGPAPGYKSPMRDPWVWREGNTWYMIVGATTIIEQGQTYGYPVYRSANLIDWEYLNPLWGQRGCAGAECPGFLALGDKYALLVNNTCFIGKFENHRFAMEKQSILDCSRTGFHVPQGLIDNKGRRILWGWVVGRKETMPESWSKSDADWGGMLSMPRVMTLQPDNTIRLEPPEELKGLRGRHKTLKDILAKNGDAVLKDIGGPNIEIEAVFAPDSVNNTAKRYGIELFDDYGKYFTIVYDVKLKEIAMDEGSGNPSRSRSLELNKDEPLVFRVFFDGSIVESFVNKTLCYTDNRYPADPANLKVRLVAEDGQVTASRIDVWEMGTIWSDYLKD